MVAPADHWADDENPRRVLNVERCEPYIDWIVLAIHWNVEKVVVRALEPPRQPPMNPWRASHTPLPAATTE
jgi:hypothetical protein